MRKAGLIGGISDTHFVDSDKESGKGYYDILPTPKEGHGDLGIIFEFKYVKEGQSLGKAAKRAVRQIIDTEYAKVLERTSHVKRALAIGLAFCGKEVVSSYRKLDMETRKLGEIYLIKRYRDSYFIEDETGHDREEPPRKRIRNKR